MFINDPMFVWPWNVASLLHLPAAVAVSKEAAQQWWDLPGGRGVTFLLIVFTQQHNPTFQRHETIEIWQQLFTALWTWPGDQSHF